MTLCQGFEFGKRMGTIVKLKGCDNYIITITIKKKKLKKNKK